MIRDKNKILLVLLFLLYLSYFTLVSVLKFKSFAFYDFDLAVHDLSMWSIIHGSIYNSILGLPFLGNHAHIVLFIITPIYLLFSHPLTLLSLQTLALGMCVFPLYSLTKDSISKNWGLIIAIAFILYPALGYVNLFEFHPTAFATFFLVMVCYSYQKKNFVGFVVYSLLAMACQENIALGIIMFSAVAFLQHRASKWVVFPLLGGIFYFIFAVSLMAYFNNHTIEYSRLYEHLRGNSISNAIIFLFRKETLTYFLNIFLPLAFISLLNPLWLIPALPFFLQHLLSARPSDLSIFHHYTAEIIPFVFISAIYGLKVILNNKWLRMRQRYVTVCFLSIVLVSNIYMGPYIKTLPNISGAYKIDYLDTYKYKLINQMPQDASVVATFEFLPHLTHRRFLYSLHHIYAGFYTLSSKKYPLPENIEYALIDFNDFLTFRGFYGQDSYKNLQNFILNGKWGIVDFMEDIVFFRKGSQLSCDISQKISDPQERIKQKNKVNIEGEVELIGHDYNALSAGLYDITLYWKCLRPTQKDIVALLFITDSQDQFIKQIIHPLCYRIFPTNSWREGEFYKERIKLFIPKEPPYKISIAFFDFRTGRIYDIKENNRSVNMVLLTNIK